MAETKKIIKKVIKKTSKKRDLGKTKKTKVISEKKVKKIEKPKKIIKKEVKKVVIKLPKKPSVKYFSSIGRRKTSYARVRLFTQGDGKEIKVNEKSFDIYFVTPELQKIVKAPLEVINSLDKFTISVRVKGGGIHSQAEAVRHGISRALCLLNPYFKKKLREKGFLTRDSRMRERKKFGLKRARRAPQWSKR